MHVETPWMQASLVVAAPDQCSGSGSSFTGKAFLDLAWLNSAGTIEAAAIGFKRCPANATVAEDEVWYVSVTAGMTAVEVVGPHTPNRLSSVRLTYNGDQGESLVPPHTCGSVSLCV